MEISKSVAEEFNWYCHVNNLFWREDEAPAKPSPEKGAIFLDLLHDYPPYILRSLFIGKSLQKYYGCPVIGLTGDLGFFRKEDSSSQYNFGTMKALADSFGLDRIIEIDLQQVNKPEVQLIVNKLVQQFRKLTPDQVMRFLLQFRDSSGLPLGRFIYESVVRYLHVHRIPEFDDKAVGYILETFLFYEYYKKLFTEHGVFGVVAGHISYSSHGLLAHIAMDFGAKIFQFRADANMSSYIVSRDSSSKPDADYVGTLLRDADRHVLKNVIEPKKDKVLELAQNYQRRIYNGSFYMPTWWPQDEVEGTRDEIRRRALGKLDLDINKKTVGTFLHCLADSPYFDEHVYDDYYEWTTAVLELAINHPEKNWIFKQHPHWFHYDGLKAVDELSSKVREYSHIKFILDELTPTEVISASDVVTTARGSVGFQSVPHGVTTILSGQSLYSDWGFVNSLPTRSEYEQALVQDPEILAPSSEQKELATMWFYYERVIASIKCLYMPYYGYFEVDEMWKHMAFLLKSNLPEEDPFFRNFKRSLDEGLPRLINFDVLD